MQQILEHYQAGRDLDRATTWNARRIDLLRNPAQDIQEDLNRIYYQEHYAVGWPEGLRGIYDHLALENTYAILGGALGDEGKGRIVDNTLDMLVHIKGVRKVYVRRFQGGSNSGHTIQRGGQKLAQHQIPCISFEKRAVGIMDSMMNINPDEVMIEYNYIENVVGKDSLKGRLIISREAVLNTDLDRAEETLLDRIALSQSGSTKRGMRTSSAHYYERTGMTIKDLVDPQWEQVAEQLGKKYDQLALDFQARGWDMADVEVPDYDKIVRREGDKRKMETRQEFLDRMEGARDWLKSNDLVHNTFPIHRQAWEEIMQGKAGSIDEGAQAIALHPWLGTLGDTTSTDTGVGGILDSTKVWQARDIKYRMGVFKLTYTSSVGKREMVTKVPLEKNILTEKDAIARRLTLEQIRAAWIREVAHEFGTTTGRPRDICNLDLAMLAYNCDVGNIEMLAATHVDIARRKEFIKVCTHYTRDGVVVPYQPGIEYQKGIQPQYVELPGWDMTEVQQARTFDQLPKEAKQFMAFIQARLGIPIVMATTGPNRDQLLEIPNYRQDTPINRIRHRFSPNRNFTGEKIQPRRVQQTVFSRN